MSGRRVADGPGDAELAHEAFDGAPGNDVALSVQLPPDLPGSVDTVVVDTVVGVEDLPDEGPQLCVTDSAGGRGPETFAVGVAGGGGDLAVVLGEHAADRLDAAEAGPVLVDERYERVCGRSSSAAKRDAAAFRMSFARFSSAFSFFNALSWADSSVVVPAGDRSRSRPASPGSAASRPNRCPASARLPSARPIDSGSHRGPRRPYGALVCAAQEDRRKGVP